MLPTGSIMWMKVGSLFFTFRNVVMIEILPDAMNFSY